MPLRNYRPKFSPWMVGTLFAALVFSICWISLAQQPEAEPAKRAARPVERPVILAVFRAPAIQHDLALNDKQIANLAKLGESPQIDHPAHHDDASRAALKRILTIDQYNRFEQIMLRSLMVRGFDVPDVAARLDLSPEQRKKIAAIRSNLKLQLLPFQTEVSNNGFPKDYSRVVDLEQGVSAFHTHAYEQALAVLTPGQRTVWEKALGPTVHPR